MRNKLRDVLVALAGAAVAAAAFYAATPTEGQAPASRVPRMPDGRPNLNGIWQALNTANYDIEAHPARPALAMRPGPVIPVPAREVVALGAVGSVPAGVGVVVGGPLPYTPEGLAKKKENQDNWLTRDPEVKCYLPGVPRATYMPWHPKASNAPVRTSHAVCRIEGWILRQLPIPPPSREALRRGLA
jgi:hypothetical protein